MNERAFRLDFFIAIAALLVSSISAFALLYQSHVTSQQFSATIWPYLAVSGNHNDSGEKLGVVNDGMGPALIRSAQLSIDGNKITGWNEYFSTLVRDPAVYAYFQQAQQAQAAVKAGKFIKGSIPRGSITTDSLYPGDTIRPGDAVTLISFDLPYATAQSFEKHTIALDLCYCSLNGECWKFHSVQHAFAGSETQRVAQCDQTASIAEIDETKFLSVLQRKR